MAEAGEERGVALGPEEMNGRASILEISCAPKTQSADVGKVANFTLFPHFLVTKADKRAFQCVQDQAYSYLRMSYACVLHVFE